MRIYTSSDLNVDTGDAGNYCIHVTDLEKGNKSVINTFADGKKQAIAIAVKKVFPNDSWHDEVYEETTTWFDLQQRLIELDIDVEIEEQKK